MNARYVLTDSPADLGAHFGIDIRDNFPARFNIAPSQPVPVITHEEEERRYGLVRWGFVPAWDREGRFLKQAIVNIRSETAHEKPMFRSAWRRRHCLFPMNGFYEWRTEGKVKQPYLIARAPGMPLFCLAGLYEDYMSPDGSELRTAAFLTREAEGEMRRLHSRLPVVVAPHDYERWLTAGELDPERSTAVTAQPAAKFTYWPVDRKVGSWKEDGAELIQPIEDGEIRSNDAPEPQRTRLL